MTHWIQVFRYELRQQFRRKAYIAVTFGLPLLALAIFFGYQLYRDWRDDDGGEGASVLDEQASPQGGQTVGYVDLTREGLFPAPSRYSAVECALTPEESAVVDALDRSSLIQRLSSPYCVRERVMAYETFEAGKDALGEGAIEALYVVEADYVETGVISSYATGFSLELAGTDSLFEDYVIRSLLHNTSIDAETYEALYLRLRNPAFISTHEVSETGATQTSSYDQNFLLVYGFGLGMMLSIMWGGGYLMQSVVQEKESRIVEIILSSVRPMGLLAGKVTAMGLAALIQVGMLVGTFIFIGSQAGDVVEALGDLAIDYGAVALMMVYFMLGFLLLGSLMAGIGAIVGNMRESQNLVTVVTLPAAIPFFFTAVFAQNPDSPAAVIMSFIPLTAPLAMIMRLAVTDVPLVQLALSLAILVLSVLAAIWMAGRLFRARLLLAGGVPKLRDIPTLLRG